jgi:uncharacterized protein
MRGTGTARGRGTAAVLLAGLALAFMASAATPPATALPPAVQSALQPVLQPAVKPAVQPEVQPAVQPAAQPTPAAAPDAPRGADGLLVVPPLARVTDLAGVLSAADRSALDAKLAGFESSHGAQIAVIVVPSTKPEPIEDFAHRVGDAWKIGRKGIGDGLLVVVATADRTARIDVARNLEGAIPDVTALRVIREQMAPHFVSRDYAGGLNAAADALFGLVTAENLPAPSNAPTPSGLPQQSVDAGEDVVGMLVPFVIGGVILGSLLRRLFGFPGALVAAGGAGALAGVMLTSLALGGLAALAVFVLAFFFGPFAAAQVLGGRFGGGGFGGGGFGGGGGGGFRSGGGGDFSGGGASGNW